MNIKDLRPAVYNPRKITDQKLLMLEKSLKEFGDLSGFVFNKRTGNLVGGHQRQKVMPPDCEIIIEQKFDQPTEGGTIALGKVLFHGEKFSYREVDWNETKEKAANIAANKHGGEFDLGALEQIILDLDHANYDLDLTGFDSIELDNLFEWRDKPELDDKEKNSSDELNHILEIHFNSESEMLPVYDELLSRGLIVKAK